MGTGGQLLSAAVLRKRVQEANNRLANRWIAVSSHLRLGLARPIGGSVALYKTYVPPDHYPGSDGKSHRKPVRAFYGFGQTAQHRFDYDMYCFNSYRDYLKTQVDRDNSAVDYWAGRARAGDVEAVGWYCKTVLPLVLAPIPGAIGAYLRTAYSVEEQRILVVDRYVPGIDVIPETNQYEIRQSRNLLHSIPVATQRRDLHYLDFLAQVALLTLDNLFRCEISDVIDIAVMNCLTVMLNTATGHNEVAALLSVRVSKKHLASLNLYSVKPLDCIAQLDFRLTKHPGEFSPVIPLAATEQGVVNVTVKDAPLLEMSPSDFEQLVTELLRRMGLRAKRTGQTGDGGIDCEAYDDRPLIGGKVIVQVKRYSNIVAPTVIRDLFGTVHATGATKGVLVTTSGFGPESREFVQGKPLELIDGVQLEALLRQFQLGPSEQSLAGPELAEATLPSGELINEEELPR